GPAVVTDGSRIYFNEDSGVTRVIGQVAIAGSDTAPLTVPLNRPLIHDLSRSGSQLLVIPEAWSTGANLEQSLWLVPLPSCSPRPVGEVLASAAGWTPDEKHIVYAKGRDLFVVNRDGSADRKLLSAPGYVAWPRVSPDGNHIRFTAISFNGTQALWQATTSGS